MSSWTRGVHKARPFVALYIYIYIFIHRELGSEPFLIKDIFTTYFFLRPLGDPMVPSFRLSLD